MVFAITSHFSTGTVASSLAEPNMFRNCGGQLQALSDMALLDHPLWHLQEENEMFRGMLGMLLFRWWLVVSDGPRTVSKSKRTPQRVTAFPKPFALARIFLGT